MTSPKEPIPSSKADSPDDTIYLDAPKVPEVIDPDDPGGLLPRSALAYPLEVTFMEWDFSTAPNREDIVELGFQAIGTDFVPVDEKPYPTPITVPFPQSLFVPRDRLKNGVYEVSIKVYKNGVNPIESFRKKITIDTDPPNFNQRPDHVVFPAELNGTITEDYLTQHGQVIVDVPWYPDVVAKDRAVYFWTDKPTPPDSEVPIREQEFSQPDIDDRRLLITVYADEIRAWGAGDRYMYYRLRDRAGNTGPISRLAPIYVDLTPAPGALRPPRVPLSDRGLIDREHARARVFVEIDSYDGAAPGDWIAVNWDGTPLDEFPVDPTGFDLEIPVPWGKLVASGLGPLRARVDYRVRRGTVYTPPSPDITVPLNLTVAGQDHPGAPALLNPLLALPDVYGKSGIPNELIPSDKGHPVIPRVALYDNPVAGELLEFHWGNWPGVVANYRVQPGDTAGKLVSFSEVSWEVIGFEPNNPRLPVYYTTSNGVNQQQSENQFVKVQVVTIDDLKAPTFPDADKWGKLDCCARPRLWEGVTVRVAAHPEFLSGDEVVLYWQGCRNLNGTDPIDGVYAKLPKTLNDDEAREGFDVFVTDYEALIAPMAKDGSALVYYVLNKNNGGMGRSKDSFVIINRTMPSGDVCSPTNETCTSVWQENEV